MSVFKVRVDLLAGLLALASTVGASGAKRDDGRTGFLDPKGNWYLAGETGSIDWPVTNPFQATFAGNGDAVVAKLVPTGQTDAARPTVRQKEPSDD